MSEAILSNGNTVLKAINALSADGATKLVTPRTIQVNLGSTSSASFDGSANITPGVTGVLPVSKGGTGYTSLSNLKSALGIDSSSGVEIASGRSSGVGSYTRTMSIYIGFSPKLFIMTPKDITGQSSSTSTTEYNFFEIVICTHQVTEFHDFNPSYGFAYRVDFGSYGVTFTNIHNNTSQGPANPSVFNDGNYWVAIGR